MKASIKFTFLMSTLFLCIFCLSYFASAELPRARSLASVIWQDAGYFDGISVADAPEGLRVLILSRVSKTDDGAYYAAAEGSGAYEFLLRGEGIAPVFSTSLILDPKQRFDPSPWKAAEAMIDFREKLYQTATAWDSGTDDEKTAAAALRQLADFQWEDKPFLVQCWVVPEPDIAG